MNLQHITENQIATIVKLCASCFTDDPFYKELSSNHIIRFDKLVEIFKKSLYICMEYGHVYGHVENGTFVSFAMWFDYHKLKRNSINDFNFIFEGTNQSQLITILSNESKIIDSHLNSCKKCLFLLAIGVNQLYRRKGLGQELVSTALDTFPQYNFYSDISNKNSLKIYQNLGFDIIGKYQDIYFVKHISKLEHLPLDPNIINLAIPSSLDISFLKYTNKQNISLNNIGNDTYNRGFSQSMFSNTEVTLIQITYNELLKYQRFINILYYDEIIQKYNNGDFIIYYCDTNNKYLNDQEFYEYLPTNKEQNLIPDCLICIPIEYDNITFLSKKQKFIPSIVENFITALDFRTNYESGIPVDGLEDRGFKNRITRLYLGMVSIQIVSENQLSFNQTIENTSIGPNIDVAMIISIDNQSKCGVLHIISLSCGLMITQLLDSISRNQIIIEATNGSLHNLYSFLSDNFNILKKGTAKSFVTFSQERNSIDNDLLSSSLFCETLYDNGESLGKVIDNDIAGMLAKEYGTAQYNYACVYSYTNIVIQTSPSFQGSIHNRIRQESITLFYIELILFEESAINTLDNKIVYFLNTIEDYSPDKVLKDINTMISNFVKTSDFWDIQMNYPSSKKSIDEIRDSFNIEKERHILKHHKEYLMDIYNTRNDIVDKAESYIISILGAILTALSAATYFKDGTWSIAASIVGSVFVFLYGVRKIIYNTIKRKK